MTSKITFWQKLTRFSPITVRLLARKKARNGRPVAITDEQIATLSGLPIHEVKRISWASTWDDIPVGHMRKFVVACSVDIGDRKTVQHLGNYMKKPSFSYLKRSPEWETTYRPLLIEWVKRN